MNGPAQSLIADGRMAQVDPDHEELTLAHYLRDVLGLMSINIGCEEGACGACTALVNGQPVPTCLLHVARLAGTTIETAAAIALTELGARIGNAIAAGAGMQCGFCSPGIVCSAYRLLTDAPGPLDVAEVQAALSGHLCRCTGYLGFLQAIAGLTTSAGTPLVASVSDA